MSSKPKKEEYAASDTEKANASIAAAEQAYFQETYDPLLRDMRDQATTAQDRATSTLKDRAQADTMQTLTGGRPNLSVVQGVDYASNIASGAAGQLALARTKGKDIGTTLKTGVLGTARGQQADAASGLSQASRMATSSLLAKARDKQNVRLAKSAAMATVGGTIIGQIAENRWAKKTGAGGGTEEGGGGESPLTRVGRAGSYKIDPWRVS